MLSSIFSFVFVGLAVMVDSIWIEHHHVPRPPCGHVHRPCGHVGPSHPPATSEPIPPFSCEHHADGIYDLGCCSTFVSCSAGVATFLRCPGNMKYDTVSARCLGAAYVRACGGHPTTAAPEVTTTTPCFVEPETEAPEEETTTEAEAPTEEATTEEVTECEEEETTTEAEAPTEATTTEEVTECEEEETTTVEEETTTEEQEETTTEEVTEATEATTTAAATPCEGRPFGVYGHGCSPSYTICLSHFHTEKHCPSPLRYDPASHTCLSVKEIPACGGASKPNVVGVGQAF